MENLTGAIVSFDGDYRFLSNFFGCEVTHEGIIYPSSEHAYQASKTDDLFERLVIAKLPTAKKAKRQGKMLTMSGGFEANKVMTMRRIVTKKFVQNPELRVRLIDTHPLFLVEGNWWGDIFWGVCKGEGLNHLGNILMQVREELR
jgi:ribA/ribD-fused uncharacterized protein